MRKVVLYVFTLLVVCNVQATDLVLYIKDIQSLQLLSGVSLKISSDKKNKLLFTSDTSGIIHCTHITLPITITCDMKQYVQKSVHVGLNDIILQDGKYIYTLYLETETQQLQDVVITGQSTPVMAAQSLYKVQTINAKQIAQRGAVTLNDVLNYELGSFINNDNILGSSVNIGGIGGQNVKILVNGIPITGRENGNIDLGQINMANVKRIEMIQGPMSVIYGSNALGGVINIITNTSKKRIQGEARSYIENIGRYNFSGNIATQKNNHSVIFSIARNFFAGWTPNYQQDRFQIWKPKTQYLADLQYSYDLKKGKISYYGSYLNEKITNKGTPIVNSFEGYAFDEYYRTHRNIQSINTEYELSEKEKITALASFNGYTRYKNRFKKNLVSMEQFLTENTGDQDTSIFNTYNFRGTLNSQRFKNFQLLLGYEYNFETGKSFKLSDDMQYLAESGIFASANYEAKKLSIQPSMRYINNSKYKDAFTPALHAKYSINSTAQLRASYARGFRTPSMKELYLQFIDQNHTIIGNADLRPEIGDHYEIAFEKQGSIQNIEYKLQTTAMHNNIKDLIALAAYNNHGILRKYSNIAHYQNWIGNIQCQFIHKNIAYTIGTAYTYVEKSTFIPQHTIWEYNHIVSYQWLKMHASINFNYKYNSKQPVMTVENQFLYTNPLHIANASIQKTFLKEKIRIQLGARNLFNIQNSALNGVANYTGSAHTSNNGMQVFPRRSYFTDMTIRF